MKHAILLLWHKDVVQLKELISLFNSNFMFYIHLDKKSKISGKEIDELSCLDSVKGLYSRYYINWGGFNILKAELFLLAQIIKDQTVDYIHFMSGQDYLAKRPADINTFFVCNNGLEFIEWQKLPYKNWDGGSYNRFDYYRFLDCFDYRSYSGKKIVDWIVNFQRTIGYKRNIPYQYSNLYGGSNWMSITRKCGEYIISSRHKNRPFYNRLKHTWAPEETYFPTIILNSDFAGKVKNNNLRYINWVFRNNSYPAILDEKDFGNIILSDCYFIRKIDTDISAGLLSLLKKYILSDTSVNIDSHGYWTNESLAGHCFDLSLGKAIAKLLREAGVKTVADFGCGPGWYVALLRKQGFDIEGYDGNPNTPEISSSFFNDGFYCQYTDLTEEVMADEPFDAVICLEVGEHIPAEYENILFQNITNNAKQYVLLSWAIIGQPGSGHVNCKTNEYIISKMAELGFSINTPASNYLRNQSSLWWFKNTLMFFERSSLSITKVNQDE